MDKYSLFSNLKYNMNNIKDRTEAQIKPCDTQPSRAEMEEAIDMPGADMETLRQAFFKPVKVEETKS